jgi:hypothetical protein
MQNGNACVISDGLRIVSDAANWHVVSKAGYILSTNSTCWRDGAVAKTFDQLPDAYHIRLHEDLCATCWYCPASGGLLSIDFHMKDRPAPHDAVLTDEAVRILLHA